MDKFEIAKELMRCFPNSFVNRNGEFIAHREANEYFILDNCQTEEDVKYKVLAWLSRGAHKTMPFGSERKNEKFHSFMLSGINKFLGTEFTTEDIGEIYTNFGCGCNAERCREFIRSGYDMGVIDRMNKERAIKERGVKYAEQRLSEIT